MSTSEVGELLADLRTFLKPLVGAAEAARVQLVRAPTDQASKIPFFSLR